MSEQLLQLELPVESRPTPNESTEEGQLTQQPEPPQNNGLQSIFEAQGPSQTRVYISNLSFQATEEALTEFLKGHDVVSVLIPSQSIRGFQKSLVRPLGIAYAEFKTPEAAANAILELNGVMFMNRELKLRYHIPFKNTKKELPSGQKKLLLIQRRFSELRKKNVAVVCARDDAAPEENQENAGPDFSSDRETSNLSLYVGHLPGKTTDASLRDFFQEYSPQEIIVYKHRQFNGWRIRRHITAAVVTFPDNEKQKAALFNLAHVQFNGRTLKLAPAYEDKLAEIRAEVQRMAVEQHLPQNTANLGIYIGNNLIAMQPLQPKNKQTPQGTAPGLQDKQLDERQPLQDQDNDDEAPLPVVQDVQQPVARTRSQPLLKLQKLQMIQKLQRLHKQRQDMQKQVDGSESEQHDQPIPEPVAVAA